LYRNKKGNNGEGKRENKRIEDRKQRKKKEKR